MTIDPKGNISADSKVKIMDGLATLQIAIRRNNFEKGWRAETPVGETKRTVSEHVALLHSEVTEIFESYRNNEPDLWYDYGTGEKSDEPVRPAREVVIGDSLPEDNVLGKPQGMTSELADVLIRLLDFADEHQLDLIETVLEKHDYNLTRPYRHGGKQA